MKAPATTMRLRLSSQRQTEPLWRRLQWLDQSGFHGIVGTSRTTDAPFRETAQAIEPARTKGIPAVEMEAAALYTFARSAGVRVLCLAHVANAMGQAGDDFERAEQMARGKPIFSELMCNRFLYPQLI